MLALTPGEDLQAVVALAIEKEGHKVIRVTVGGEGRSQQLAGVPGLTTPSRKFCRCFEDEVGSTMCADIVESQFGRRFDLADPVEAMQWMNCGALEKCGDVIGKGVRIAAEIVSEIQD